MMGVVDLQELDLDGDWDAEKHDAQMAALYEATDDLPNEDVSRADPPTSIFSYQTFKTLD